MKKLDESLDYIGEELHLFKKAVNWKKYFSKEIHHYIKGDVLEVGAGIGINTKFLYNQGLTVKSWTLLEPDKHLFSQIGENTKDLNLPNKQEVNGTIQTIKNKKYDTIIYIDVLEHIENPSQEIQLINEKINHGGTVIILVPSYNFLYNNFDKSIGHYRRYSKRQILAENNGTFSPIKIFHLDTVGLLASILNKYMLKKELPSQNDVLFWDRIMVPFSYFIDAITFYSFGKSLIAILQKND